MKHKDLVSIIVPVYNKEKYLEKCLDSLKNQTYTNIEVLIVDDGSSDNSKEICNIYIESDKRFNYFYHKNSGVSFARNVGIDNSNGNWIMFVDPDDYVELSIVEVLMDSIDYKTDIISCCCNANYDGRLVINEFFDSDRIFSNTLIDKIDINMALMDEQYKSHYNRITAIGVPWGKLYRRNLLNDNNIRFDVELKRMQDNIFNMYAFEVAREIKYVNKQLYIYSCDNILSINQKYDKFAVNYYNKIVNERRRFLIRNNLFEIDEINEAFKKEAYKLFTIMVRRYFLNKNNRNNFFKKVSNIKRFINTNGYKEIFNSINLKSGYSITEMVKINLLKRNIFIYSILYSIKN